MAFIKAGATRRNSARVALLAGTALTALALAMPAQAQQTWQGGTVGNPTDWFDPNNWTTAVPTAADNVFIAGAGAANMPIISSVTASGALIYLGDGGEPTGTLTIQNSGILNSGNGNIALDIGTNYSVTVTGTGSRWNSTGFMLVGYGGNGGLTITDGGAVTNTSATIADQSTGTGSVTVTGAGSTWVNSGDLLVGNAGNGSLTISDGGTVSNALSRIGNVATGTGAVRVTGDGSTWTNSSVIVVGDSGQGLLRILEGATVTSTNGVIASEPGSIGTAVVRDAGSSWSTTVGTLNVGGNGQGSLVIFEGGIVNVAGGTGDVNVAINASSEGTVIIGHPLGDGPGPAGTLNAGALNFGSGTGTLIFNHTDSNHTFTPDITGIGTIQHAFGTTTYVGDGSAFNGMTNITNGTFNVNSNLGGTVNVSGGTLGGTGILSGGSVTVGVEAEIAPGNSIGTLTVPNITISGLYTVELRAGGFVAGVDNDFINATGAATVTNGLVHVTPENGTDNGTTYTPGQYTILTAAGGVVGTFTSLTEDYAFLDFVLSYDANNVYLNSSIGVTSFCVTGMTPNQCATGEGTFSLGGGNSVFDAVLALSSAEAPGALDQLSGEIHASAKTALLEDSRFPREAALNRLRVSLGGAAAGAGQATEETPEGVTLWAQGFGSWSRWNSDGNAAELSRNIGGLFMGADGEVTDNVYAGLMGGYSRSSVSVSDRMSSGTVDSYTLGAYAGGAWDAFSLRGGVAHTWHSLATSRSVSFTGFTDSLSASYNARTLQAYTEAAYTIEAGNARFEPFANVAFVNLNTDGFTETGGAAALTANGQSTDATFTTLGIRGETTVALGETNATLSAGLGWRHAFGDTPTSTHSFAAGGDAFTIAGVPLARDVLVLDAGLEMNLTDSATLGISYNGQIGSGISDHGAKVSLNVSL